MAGAGKGNYLLISIAALNIVISLYYYLRVIKAVFMDANPMPLPSIRIPLTSKLAFAVCIAGVVFIGVASPVYDYIYSLISHL